MYSVDAVDSDGNSLSEAQAEFFKGSKVRDKDGALIPVYHSTGSKHNVFDIAKTRSYDGKVDYEIPGHYFTADRDESAQYGGRTVKAYLNIVNPFTGNYQKI